MEKCELIVRYDVWKIVLRKFLNWVEMLLCVAFSPAVIVFFTFYNQELLHATGYISMILIHLALVNRCRTVYEKKKTEEFKYKLYDYIQDTYGYCEVRNEKDKVVVEFPLNEEDRKNVVSKFKKSIYGGRLEKELSLGCKNDKFILEIPGGVGPGTVVSVMVNNTVKEYLSIKFKIED